MPTFKLEDSVSNHSDRMPLHRDDAVYALAKTVVPAWIQCPHEASMLHVAVAAALVSRCQKIYLVSSSCLSTPTLTEVVHPLLDGG